MSNENLARAVSLGASYCRLLIAVEQAMAEDNALKAQAILMSVDPLDLRPVAFVLDELATSIREGRTTPVTGKASAGPPLRDARGSTPLPSETESSVLAEPQSLDAWRVRCD